MVWALLLGFLMCICRCGGEGQVGSRCEDKYPVTKPLLSVVFTTQGGTFGDLSLQHPARRATYRLVRQLWWLGECARRYNLSMEVVILDWPVEVENSLRQNILAAMKAEKLSFPTSLMQLRILEGPRELLSRVKPDLPVLEYMGKNIAARRSFGHLILLGGTDSLPHESIFRYLASERMDINLRQASCYGSSRQMTGEDIPDSVETFDDYVAWRDSIQWDATHPHLPYIKHTGPPLEHPDQIFRLPGFLWFAAGDFTLCTRKAIHTITGYVEESFRAHVDTYFLRKAVGCGVPIWVLHPSMANFHQNHDRGIQIISEHPISRPEVSSCADDRNENWGAPDMRMEEYLFSRGDSKWFTEDCIPTPSS